MIFIRICHDCGVAFPWHTPFKKICPHCAKKHRLAVQRKYNHSQKGKDCSDRREERMKQTRTKRHNMIPNRCQECGTVIRRQSKRCRPCYLKRGKGNVGKRIIYLGGYTRIKIPDNPRADRSGYMQEHTFVWEQANGKFLPKGWAIHHLNGIRDDNRIQNLLAMPDRKHHRILDAKAKRIQELEALLNNQHQLL